MRFLLIGDVHLRSKSAKDFLSLKKKVFEIIDLTNPEAVVFMGDLLDTNDVVKVSLHKMMTNFIEELSTDRRVFIVIGNHDYSSPSQYLTDNHIFNPLKKWKNVTVVDQVISYKDSLFMPYVPPGKFLSALEGIDLSQYKRIFCHQSFIEVVPFAEDSWRKDLPQIISGHIHDSSSKDNIFYTGSSLQDYSNENPDKILWLLVTLEEDRRDFPPGEIFIPYPTDIKGIESTYCKFKNLFTVELDEYHDNRLVISGKKSEFKGVKNKKEYKELESKAKIEWRFLEEELQVHENGNCVLDFREILSEYLSEEEKKVIADIERE